MQQNTFLKENFYKFSLWVFAFLIPFNASFLVPFEVLFIIGFFVSQKPKDVWSRVKKDRFSILSLLYFALVIISILVFKGHNSEMERQLLLKLPFLLMPLFIIGSDLTKKDIKFAVLSFCLGCLLSGLFQLGLSTSVFLREGKLTAFTHYDFAHLMHITYLGMYQSFAFAFFLYVALREDAKWRKVFYFMGSAFCLLFVLLSAAKIMILALMAIAFVMIAIFLRKERKGFLWWSLPVIVLLFPLILYKSSDAFKLRIDSSVDELVMFYNNEDHGRAYSTGQRILLWKNAIPIVKNNPIMGVGVANVQNAINVQLEYSGDASRFPFKLNMHNEYLQNLVGMGAIGLIIIVLLMLSPLRYRDLDRVFIVFTFVVVVCFASFSESIFERQAGVLFFQLIGSLLVAWYYKEHEESSTGNK